MKNIRLFLSENYQVLEVKLSIYLNRRVFVMSGLSTASTTCTCTFYIHVAVSSKW